MDGLLGLRAGRLSASGQSHLYLVRFLGRLDLHRYRRAGRPGKPGHYGREPLGQPNQCKLSLWGNEITDVSPLARLTNLQWLQLGDNDIADISPLASLTNLQWLGVVENALSQHAANQQLAASMASGLRVEAVLEKYPRVETVQVYPELEEPEPVPNAIYGA